MILPEEYVIEKFYTFGYQPKHNRYNKTYQCGCPICREGKSLGSTRRCFFIPKNNNIFCHNCGWSSTPYNWIKKVAGLDDQHILTEVSKFDYSKEVSFKDVDIKKEYVAPTLPDDSINLFDNQQLSFYSDNKVVKECMELVNRRRLLTAINRPKSLYISLKDKTHKNRLIIPFVDERNDIVFYQSRTVLQQDLQSKSKYVSKIGSDKALYGINNVNIDLNYLFLFEGPINAMFTKNGLAVAGISKGNHNFTPLQEQQLNRFTLMNRIWVLDSQWIDKTSLVKTKKLLEQGEKVFIWPEKYGKQLKDFNDICMKYSLDEITPDFIIANSYTHLQGMVLLSQIIKAHSSYAPLSGK
jgi:hypothetical protein